MIKRTIVRFLRKRALQPVHERLLRLAKIGMNHWGGAEIDESGERVALARVAQRCGGRPAIILDVGANVGTYSAAALTLFPTGSIVHAFEPASAAFERLMELGHTDGPVRMVPHRFGFSDRAGQGVLFGPHPGSSIASMHPDPQKADIPSRTKEAIELRTIDQFCAENGISRIDLLKIDAEGHELAVLQGASTMLREGAIEHIQFEFGERHIDARVFFRDIFQLLTPDFVVNRIVRDGIWPIPSYSPDLEIFNTANFLAECKVPGRSRVKNG